MNQIELAPDILGRTMKFHQQGDFVFDPRFNHLLRLSALAKSDLLKLEFTETRFLTATGADVPLGGSQIKSLLRNRSSVRFSANKPLAFTAIERLLHTSFGSRSSSDRSRPYPSAGALYPVEVMIMMLSSRLKGAPPSGVYHYLPVSKALEPLRHCPEAEMMKALTGLKSPAGRPHFAVAYFLNMKKALGKYRYRGYRHALMEAGSMYHQADLVAKTLGLSTRVWSAFSDQKVARICGLNPTLFVPVTTQWFGTEDA